MRYEVGHEMIMYQHVQSKTLKYFASQLSLGVTFESHCYIHLPVNNVTLSGQSRSFSLTFAEHQGSCQIIFIYSIFETVH